MNPEHGQPGAAAEVTAYLAHFGEHYVEAIDRAKRPGHRGPQHPRRTRRVRRRILAATLVAVAVVGGAVTLPSPGRIDVVEAASAALGRQGDIVHYVIRPASTFQGIRPSSKTGPRCTPPTEVWQATSRPQYRVLSPPPPAGCPQDDTRTADGRHVTGPREFAVDGTTQTTYLPELHALHVITDATDPSPSVALVGMPDATADPVADIRQALSSGRLHPAGTTTRRSRKALVLTGRTTELAGGGKPPSGLIITHELRYVVDANSYTPVEVTTSDTTHFFKGNGRPKDGSFGSSSTITFQTYEALPYTAANKRLLAIHPTTPVTTTTKTAAQAAADQRALTKKRPTR